MKRIPDDYCRCAGQDVNLLCARRDNCQRYVGFKPRLPDEHPAWSVVSFPCTDRRDYFIPLDS